jgi:glucose/arabinose dehydrogenase
MYDYDSATGKVSGSPKTLVTGMQFSTVHPTRAILVSKFDPDKILVAVGSNSNIDQNALTQTGGRSMIKIFSIAETSAATANYNRDGKVLGWGLRNIVGMGEDPAYGGIVSFFLLLSMLISSPEDLENRD